MYGHWNKLQKNFASHRFQRLLLRSVRSWKNLFSGFWLWCIHLNICVQPRSKYDKHNSSNTIECVGITPNVKSHKAL